MYILSTLNSAVPSLNCRWQCDHTENVTMHQERFKGKSTVGQDGGGANPFRTPLGAKPHIYISLPQEGFMSQMGPGSMFKRQRE